MAELVQNQRSTVDISKMIGRNDNIDPYDDERGTLGQILELNILDPKPDRPRSKGLVFSDPDKVPRFENLTLEGTVLHSCAVICLWYNTVDHYEQLYSEYYYLAEWNVMVIHVDLTRY